MARDAESPAAPGWYRHPIVHEAEAYWNGESWTGATRRPVSRRDNRRTALILITVLLGGALLAGAAGCMSDIYCVYDFTYLPALKADPMANLDLPGTDLDRKYNDGEGRILGKPTHAEVIRIYRIENQDEASALVEKAAAYAESAGWDLEEGTRSGYRGTKTLATGHARLFIGLSANDPLRDPGGPRVLTVVLENLEYESPG